MVTTETFTSEHDPTAEPAVELDSFAPPGAQEHDTARCVIATFNIRYAVGRFLFSGWALRKAGIAYASPRPLAVARNIAAAADAFTRGRLMPRADVIALQEADRGTTRAGGLHVARELARVLALNYAHAPMHIPRGEQPKDRQWYLDFEERIRIDDQGDTGVALLSRFPLIAARRVDLPWTECAWRPRLALAAQVMLGGRRLHVFNTHIDPHANLAEQLAQHEAVLAESERVRGEPTVLLGDFNTLFPASRAATRALLEARGFTTPMPTRTSTWRAGLARLHADWFFVRDLHVRRWGVARPLSVSDHWPVWTEVELPAQSA